MNQTNPANTKPSFDDLPDDALIRLKDLLEFNVIPFSATTIWRKIKARTFPEPHKISENISAFRVGDLRQWLKAPAGDEVICTHQKPQSKCIIKGDGK